jgi:hypothetical protein
MEIKITIKLYKYDKQFSKIHDDFRQYLESAQMCSNFHGMTEIEYTFIFNDIESYNKFSQYIIKNSKETKPNYEIY